MAASGAHDLGKGVPGVGRALVFAFIVSVAVAACKPSKTPRETARSTLALLAVGVRVGDQACASIATARKDLELAETCAKAYGDVRANLAIAEDALDVSDELARKNMPCAVEAAVAALRRIGDRSLGRAR